MCLNPRCCWYHKGTNFQANHNKIVFIFVSQMVVADTTKVRIFKQITTWRSERVTYCCCCWYHKGTNFQANHNLSWKMILIQCVVADTTKVRIFKQITTWYHTFVPEGVLLLIPQRYEFSSKSQLDTYHSDAKDGCCWYHKGTNFQANHNRVKKNCSLLKVVADTTKVRIFKQITTIVAYVR